MREEDIEILNRLYNLVLNPNVRDFERQLIFTAKQQIEAGQPVKREIAKLEANLRPLAVRYNLTPSVEEFYAYITKSKIFGLGIGAMRDLEKQKNP